MPNSNYTGHLNKWKERANINFLTMVTFLNCFDIGNFGSGSDSIYNL
jgi:hypothetical protein